MVNQCGKADKFAHSKASKVLNLLQYVLLKRNVARVDLLVIK